jgi:sigma-E factor negative regulatory protein RseA
MDDAAFSFEALSALTDGEANEREVARACAAWRDHEEARERWQAYHLVGDVMRSDDGLARGRRSDADFLVGVRDRLAQEPVVLAPMAKPAPANVAAAANVASVAGAQALHHRRWAGPMSVAAGFVLTIGAVVSALNGGSLAPSMTPQGAPGAVLAQGQQGQGPAPVMAQAFTGGEAPLSAGLQQGLSSALAADGASPQRVMVSNPSFNENAREGAGNRVGYLVLMRDDQLDQLLAAQRERAEARSLASPSGMLRSVSLSSSDH